MVKSKQITQGGERETERGVGILIRKEQRSKKLFYPIEHRS